MINNFTVVTLPQWALFAAITIIIYGWTEQKKAFGLTGTGIFILLGLYALWVIQSGWLIPEEVFDTREAFGGEDLFLPDEIPMLGRMLPFYWAMVANILPALMGFITELKDKRLSRVFKIISILVGLLIFFGMIGAVRL